MGYLKCSYGNTKSFIPIIKQTALQRAKHKYYINNRDNHLSKMKELYEANINARRIQNRKKYYKSNEAEKKKNELPTDED